MSKLLVYFGTFDPPHQGHIDGASYAQAAIGAEKILFVPLGFPKPDDHIMTLGFCRVNMLRIWAGYRKDIVVDSYETELGYEGLISVLEANRLAEGEDTEIYLLMEPETAFHFHEHECHHKLLSYAKVIVLSIPPFVCRCKELREQLPECIKSDALILETPFFRVRSKEIRRALHRGAYQEKIVVENLTEDIIGYIKSHGLYFRKLIGA